MQDKPFCFLNNKEMGELGLEELGYESWQALWQDYTIFALVRNPYDRAGSSFDYILGRHKVRKAARVGLDALPREAYKSAHWWSPACWRLQKDDGMCARPSFQQFCARPYILGAQTLLFGCGDSAIHDLYHVEPQSQCLLDGDGKLALDWLIRCAIQLGVAVGF